MLSGKLRCHKERIRYHYTINQLSDSSKNILLELHNKVWEIGNISNNNKDNGGDDEWKVNMLCRK